MNLPDHYQDKFGRAGPKVDYEFQSLGIELQPFYGRKIWSLFHKAGMTENKIREAHDIAVKRKKVSYGYLIGVLKRL